MFTKRFNISPMTHHLQTLSLEQIFVWLQVERTKQTSKAMCKQDKVKTNKIKYKQNMTIKSSKQSRKVVCLKCVLCICVCRGVVTLCNACVTNIIKQWKQNSVPDNSADSHYISAVQKDRGRNVRAVTHNNVRQESIGRPQEQWKNWWMSQQRAREKSTTYRTLYTTVIS